MHRCLEISEILRAICDQLDRRSLAALARTCQGLRDPALDAIWHSQRSLVPLLKCLPRHIWLNPVEDKRPLKIRHPITPDDWQRVQIYSHRVKKLSVDVAELDAEFFRTIELSAPASFLLPNLRILSWTVEDEGFFPFCRLFLPPSLNRVTLVLQDSPPDLSMFSTLPMSHPDLTEIRLDMPASTSSVRVLSNAICAWKSITKLAVPTLDETGLLHIATLPQLQELHMQCYVPPNTPECLRALLPARCFPVLRHLDIVSDTLQSASSLIAHISSTRLREVHINADQCAPSSTWKEAFNILAQLPSHAHLASLSLCQRSNVPPIPVNIVEKYILGPQTISPLLSLGSLTNLLLQPFYGLDLDDETLHQMAAAWPRLEILELGGERATPRPPRATLRALVYLAEHCPTLHSVQLALDATDPVPRFSRPRHTRPAHMLGYLHTGPSPINTPSLVAAFLSDIFAAIAFGHRPDTDANRAWNEVAQLFQVFRSVRAAEARCWTGEESDSDGASSNEETCEEYDEYSSDDE
ncbi:hypothetical protein DFH09DRAFT_1024146 [Mycena vulgaris]|nr:hypothetical protein DFH09DRAFT_1024146 [Mycena vulgaris]